jgi:hypothetical protein
MNSSGSTVDHPPRRANRSTENRIRLAQLTATVTALATALLYFLIGFGMLNIGTSTQGTGNQDLLGFGVASGVVYVIVAALVYLIKRRVVWILTAVLDFLVIIMYFAVASVRQPPYEIWGLLIKALELVLLGALMYLIYRSRKLSLAGEHRGEPSHPQGIGGQ